MVALILLICAFKTYTLESFDNCGTGGSGSGSSFWEAEARADTFDFTGVHWMLTVPLLALGSLLLLVRF